MIKQIINKVIQNINLQQSEMEEVMREIMNGEASSAQIAAFITGLRMKGESVGEITAAAKIMREYALKIETKTSILDTCGTGGDSKGTFNISTISAIVAAGAGVVVAKHGNRSVSSKCGSADILKALGVNIEISKEIIKQCLEEIGIAFLFAPLFHPAMKNVLQPRQEIGIRSIFNILGPLSNPAGAKFQLLGVYDKKLCSLLVNVLKNLGSQHCLVVHSQDGMDEISTTDKTFVWELNNGEVKNYEIKPSDFGFHLTKIENLQGGDIKQNVEISLDVLKGKKFPPRDIVLLNAGCAIYSSNKADSIKQGIKLAKESIDSNMALKKLEQLKEWTN